MFPGFDVCVSIMFAVFLRWGNIILLMWVTPVNHHALFNRVTCARARSSTHSQIQQ